MVIAFMHGWSWSSSSPWLCHPPPSPSHPTWLLGLLEDQKVTWKARSSPGVQAGATLSLPQPCRAAPQPFPRDLFVCCCHLLLIFNSCRINASQGASPRTLLWLVGCWQPGWSCHQLGWGFPFCASLGIYRQMVFFFFSSCHPWGRGDLVQVSAMGFSWDYAEQQHKKPAPLPTPPWKVAEDSVEDHRVLVGP